MKFNTKSAEKALQQMARGAKNRSPEIKLVIGITGVVISTILFCKGAVKAENVKNNFNEKSTDIRSAYGPIPKPQTDEEKAELAKYRREMGLTYREAAVGFVKCYALPTVIMISSLTLVVLSHKELRGRNAALAAAFAASESAYQNLRNAIKEKYGEDAEQELANGIVPTEINTVTVDENGKKKKTRETVYTQSGALSPNALLIEPDPVNDDWITNPWADNKEYMEMTINGYIKSFDLRYRNDEPICLNEIYKTFGHRKTDRGFAVIFDHTKEGAPDSIQYKIRTVVANATPGQPISDEDSRRLAYIIEFFPNIGA